MAKWNSWNTFWLSRVFKVAKLLPLYENMSHEQVLQWNKSMKQEIIRYEQRKSSPLKWDYFYKKWILCECEFLKVVDLRSIFDLYIFFFFFLMFYWMNYNFYSSVHKHRECRLNQQYKGCKSPKGQLQTGPWTHVSYSKNGEKAIQWRFRLSPFFFAYCQMRFLILGRAVGLKKET